MVASNLSWTVNWHHCQHDGGQRSLSLGVEDLSCGMEALRASCSNTTDHPGLVYDKSPCCEDKHFQVDGLQDWVQPNLLFQSLVILDLPPFPRHAGFVQAFKNSQGQFWTPPPPPRPGSLLRVLYQVFLV